MEYRVFFSYEKKTIQIQCTPKDEMKKIFERFAGKLNANINDFEFFYEGNKINKNSTLLDLINNEKNKEVLISVEKKVKIIKCPLCTCNDCILNIENYKLNFSNCKYNHNVYKIFDEYKESQKIDHSKILCCTNGCDANQKDTEFYKCLKCTQLVKRTRYYCEKCNTKHNEKHKRIKYDVKNYYCEKDFEQFKYYCYNCNKDLCDKCKNAHNNNHHIESYEIMKPKDINNINDYLNQIKDKISDLKYIIDDMKGYLDGAIKILEQYYEIGKDIIEKYELYNTNLKNHRIIQSLKNLEISNKKVMKDLNEIINDKDLNNQINNLIKIYVGDRKNYLEGIKEEVDFDSDIDSKYPAVLTEDNIIYTKKERNIKPCKINEKKYRISTSKPKNSKKIKVFIRVKEV